MSLSLLPAFVATCFCRFAAWLDRRSGARLLLLLGGILLALEARDRNVLGRELPVGCLVRGERERLDIAELGHRPGAYAGPSAGVNALGTAGDDASAATVLDLRSRGK